MTWIPAPGTIGSVKLLAKAYGRAIARRQQLVRVAGQVRTSADPLLADAARLWIDAAKDFLETAYGPNAEDLQGLDINDETSHIRSLLLSVSAMTTLTGAEREKLESVGRLLPRARLN